MTRRLVEMTGIQRLPATLITVKPNDKSLLTLKTSYFSDHWVLFLLSLYRKPNF